MQPRQNTFTPGRRGHAAGSNSCCSSRTWTSTWCRPAPCAPAPADGPPGRGQPSPDPQANGLQELISMLLVPQVKITVPQLPPEFVTRAGLCADLDVGVAADVALISAPAGYGKTLLLADWARTNTATDVAWVGVDRDDNDPKRLWSAVVAAVAGCPSVPSSGPLHAGTGLAARDPPGFHRRVRRCAAGAGAADPTDPRRRAGTGRPAGAGGPAHLHPGQARDRPARAGQPARSTAVAVPTASGRPAPRAARRPVVLHADAGRGAAGELGAATVTAPGRGPAPAHRRMGRRLTAGRSRYGGVCRPRGVPHPVLR